MILRLADVDVETESKLTPHHQAIAISQHNATIFDLMIFVKLGVIPQLLLTFVKFINLRGH